ncbi:MAG: hypothetical protein JW709_02005 [Sedimentisphaerales bacterium]|nr:hypothetical protein [Sedimentisphaerales bacterium]
MRKHVLTWFWCAVVSVFIIAMSGSAAYATPVTWALSGSNMLLVPGKLTPDIGNDVGWTATFDEGQFEMYPVDKPSYVLTGSYIDKTNGLVQAELNQTVAEETLKAYLQDVVNEQIDPGETVTITGVTLNTIRTIMVKQTFANQSRLMVMLILMGRATADADGESESASVMAMIRLSGTHELSTSETSTSPQIYDLPLNITFTGIGVPSVSSQITLTLYLGPNNDQGLAANEFAVYGQDDELGVIDFTGTFQRKGALVTLGGMAEGLAGPVKDAVWEDLQDSLSPDELAMVKDVRLWNLRSIVIAPPGQNTMTVIITGLIMVDLDTPLFDLSTPVGTLMFRGQATLMTQ